MVLDNRHMTNRSADGLAFAAVPASRGSSSRRNRAERRVPGIIKAVPTTPRPKFEPFFLTLKMPRSGTKPHPN